MKHTALCICLIFLLSGCFVLPDTLQVTRSAITIPSVTPVSTHTTSLQTSTPRAISQDYYDALPVSMGICFEAAWDAAGRVFIMRSAEDHIHFYDLADNSQLCSRAVGRVPFDFSGGDVLVGIWNRGLGCTAQHNITSFERNESTKTIRIQVQFSTDGDCPYELVRGLWLGIVDAQDFEIELIISE